MSRLAQGGARNAVHRDAWSALTGFFWIGYGLWHLGTPAVIFGGLLLIGWGFLSLQLVAMKVRRRSEAFRPTQLTQGSAGWRQHQAIRRGLIIVSIGEALGILAAVGVCAYLHRNELTWVAIALIVSLHFAPVAAVLGLRPYYFTAAAGSAAAIAVMAVIDEPMRLPFIGLAMGARSMDDRLVLVSPRGWALRSVA